MKVVKKKGENGMVHLDVTASTAEVSEALNAAGIQFCNQMGIAPMPDKTPAQAAAEQMGIKDLDQLVVQQAVEALVPRAISKHNLTPAYMPIAQPKGMIRRGRTFQFELDVMPKPQYELQSYDPVSFTIDPFEEDEEAIDREIGKMAEMYAGYTKIDDKPIENGDNALLKIDATKDGEPVPGLTTPGRTYSVGEGYMPVGFDEGIMGMVPGDVRTFTFDGPGLDENENEIMEPYEVTVEVLEIQKKALPIIDDAWVKQNMPMAKDLADLRRQIGEGSNKQRQKYYEDYKRNFAASELAKRFEGSIPDEIYEGTRGDVLRQMKSNVQQQGVQWDDFVKQQGGEQQVGMFIMLETRQQLVQGFSLDAYYRHFGLSYTEAEVDEVCSTIDPRNPQRLRQQMEAAGLGYSLREAAQRLCAAKHLVAHADIKIKGEDEETPEAAEATEEAAE